MYSALTNSEDYKLPEQRHSEEMADDVPITYVPLRNTFFLTIAAAYLESKVLDLIENEKVDAAGLKASIFIAANVMDYSGYPDCRPGYYKSMTKTIFEGSKLGSQYRKRLDIETPVILKTKAEIVKLAMELGAPLECTWSCYQGGEMPCNKCDSCILRAKGFAEADCADPLLVRLGRQNC